uniref:PHTF2 factor n=1 Tax=Macrostomum lignano TaxID=282301 RepID=A0A1I8JR23_9PLAT
SQVSETEVDRVNSDVNSDDPSSDEGLLASEDESKEELQNPEDPFLLWYRETQHGGHLHNSHTSASDKVSCFVWSGSGQLVRKVELTLLDIGWSIIQTVEKVPESREFLRLGLLATWLLAAVPLAYRAGIAFASGGGADCLAGVLADPLAAVSALTAPAEFMQLGGVLLGCCLRLGTFFMLFFVFCVAERAFNQRLQYAKYFCYLTSSRRARKSDLPHFRLNKARNIKVWLSLRSYLRKRGPQRSTNSVVACCFYTFIAVASVLCVQLLQEPRQFLQHMCNWDLLLLGSVLSIFLLRYMTLGTKINKKFRKLLNLYLCMDAKPHKKDELTVANNVLRLAEDLLKELDGPFRICGWSINPIFYNILKVVILSAISAILSDLIGFKLKLYKIKLNPVNW